MMVMRVAVPVVVVVAVPVVVVVAVLVRVRVPVIVGVIVRMRVSVGVLVRVQAATRLDHAKLGRRYTRAQHSLGGDTAVINGETAQCGAQILERQPEIQQPADDHVAGCTGEAVEIERLRQPSDLLVLSKTVVLHVREDDVIQHVDAHQHAGCHQPLRQADVIFARLRVT